jgi:hypothetical protein
MKYRHQYETLNPFVFLSAALVMATGVGKWVYDQLTKDD